jgi:hypothetical protein
LTRATIQPIAVAILASALRENLETRPRNSSFILGSVTPQRVAALAGIDQSFLMADLTPA